MPLHPQAKAFLDQLAAAGAPSLSGLPVPEARQAIRQLFNVPGEPEPVGKVEGRQILGPADNKIPLRIYTPQGSGPFPLLVYFHGGGWVLGDLETHDATCRALTNAAACIVVAVDYRLAPEHKFPAAPDDCYMALCWTALNAAFLNGDPKRLAIGGDSAGGNLTAAVALMAKDRGSPSLAYQLLIYPATDATSETASQRENADGYLLTKSDMRWFWNHYLAHEEDGQNEYASPLKAKRLPGLVPALVITAEYDPLRDEGEAYGARLREAGVPVKVSRYDGAIHGFFSLGHIMDQGKQAIAEAGKELRAAFAR